VPVVKSELGTVVNKVHSEHALVKMKTWYILHGQHL